MKSVDFLITKKESLEEFLLSFHLAKSKIYKLDKSSSVLVNQRKVKLFDILEVNDIVSIDFSILAKNEVQLWNKKIDVIYEDDDVLVVYKKENILIHNDGYSLDNLTSRVNYYLDKKNELIIPFCVNRLDKETTGLVLFAKHPLSQAYLDNEMALGKIKKEYIALVNGSIKEKKGVINYPIGKSRHENKYKVLPRGKESITEYVVLKTKDNKSLVKINLLTGRTHQIRVHFSHIKHPLIGDEIYGEKNERLYLMARKISFLQPRTKKMIEVKVDDEFGLE